MADEVTKESLTLMLRMKHDAVKRRGKPRIGQVFPDGQVDLLFEVGPTPSKLWWQCLTEAAEGTVMEGRTTASGNSAIAIQSTEDELESDVRRVDDLLLSANQGYDRKFSDAEKQLAALKNAPEDLDLEERKRRLEERLKHF